MLIGVAAASGTYMRKSYPAARKSLAKALSLKSLFRGRVEAGIAAFSGSWV
jgi:hypothetical protein